MDAEVTGDAEIDDTNYDPAKSPSRRVVDGDDAQAVERRWMRQLGVPPSLISALLERSAVR